MICLHCLWLSLLKATEQAKEEVKRVLAYLNQHLNTRTFLVGERVSLADITVVCSLLWLYKQVRHWQVSRCSAVAPFLNVS